MFPNDKARVDDETPCKVMVMLAMILKYLVTVVLPGELVMKYLQCGAKRGGWDEI